MKHEEKEGKLSDFLCSCSAAVLARSRSHYLCIRKNLSAQRMSRFCIKNSKWEINHIRTDTKLGIEERTIERRARKHLGTQPTLKHVPQVQQSLEKSMAERIVRQQRGVSVKNALLHDNKEDSTYVTDYQGFPFERYTYDVIGSYCELYKIILPID